MTAHYDARETREPAVREAELFSRLPDVLRGAMAAPAYAERLKGIDPAAVTSRTALAGLPVLRKSELPALHKQLGDYATGTTTGSTGTGEMGSGINNPQDLGTGRRENDSGI